MSLPEFGTEVQAWTFMGRFWDALLVPKMPSGAVTTEDVPRIRSLDIMSKPVYKGIDRQGRLFIAVRAHVTHIKPDGERHIVVQPVLYYARTARSNSSWGVSTPWVAGHFLRRDEDTSADPRSLFKLVSGNTLMYELPAGNKFEVRLDG